MQFYKNYYIGLNKTLKKSLPALDAAFQPLLLAPSFQKNQVYKLKRVELFLLLFWHRPLAKEPASLDHAYQVWSQSILKA